MQASMNTSFFIPVMCLDTNKYKQKVRLSIHIEAGPLHKRLTYMLSEPDQMIPLAFMDGVHHLVTK